MSRRRRFEAVISTALRYRDAESDSAWRRARAALAAAIVRWFHELPPDLDVSVELPDRWSRHVVDSGWRHVVDAAIALDGTPEYSEAQFWRLYTAAYRWAPGARWQYVTTAELPAPEGRLAA